jgi:iron(III) transport system substrate-binding protein
VNPRPLQRAAAMIAVATLAAGCRIESVSPQASASAEVALPAKDSPSGELWVYTSIYRQVLDGLDPLIKEALPGVTVHWYQAGSEKVASRLEAELAAGGTQADLLITSDPFLYARYKKEDRWLRYASANGLRTPRSLVDPDGAYAACRLSTMVIVYRAEVAEPPKSFRELTERKWKGEIALGDPLTSGTSFTWAVFAEKKYGAEFFQALRGNGAVVAGGNAAVLQKVEGGEAKVGVLLLENALAAKAKGSAIGFVYPDDGAVIVPGYAGIFRSSRNPVAARALFDLLLSPEGQDAIVRLGDMHGVDPRLSGPRGEMGVEKLIERSQAWDEELLLRGAAEGSRVKAAFSQAFSR